MMDVETEIRTGFYKQREIESDRFIEALETLLERSCILDELEDEQKLLVAGSVKALDAKRRLGIANEFSEMCQLLTLYSAELGFFESYVDILNHIRNKAEGILRENPVLLADRLVHVVRFADMPDRYIINKRRQRELRKGFGLHRGIKNDEGLSVVIAFTPPGYEQLYHAHVVDEYTLLLDSMFTGNFMSGEMKYMHSSMAMFHFNPSTYHTIRNIGNCIGRTLTVKYPLGISKWIPVLDLKDVKGSPGFGEVLGPNGIEDRGRLWVNNFRIKDAHHDYNVELVRIEPDTSIWIKRISDDYMFVVNGDAAIQYGKWAEIAGANDLIVSEANAAYALRAGKCGVEFYRVSKTD